MVTGCDKPSAEISKKIAELEQKNAAAAERQQQLEQEIQDQKLAVERDAIERERVKIEDERVEQERRQGEAAAKQEVAIRERETALANREGKLELLQSALNEKQEDLNEKSVNLSDRDRDLAGREALPFPQTEPSQPVADYSMFYDSLSSHGSWFETADYGYVWQPVAVRDNNWRPYSHGRWVCSDRGWNWDSDEPFGWATYHYGRWALLRGRGWIWVPGSEWAPSWVSWRQNDSHIGWAPLPPETLAYQGHAWDSTVDVQFGIGASWFNFVEIRHFGGPLYGHCLPVNGNGNLIIHTTNITYIHIQNRQVICGGPKYRQLSDRIGKQLPFYRLEIDQRPTDSRVRSEMRPRVKGDRMVVYAPNVNADWNDGLKPGRVTGRMESITIERERGLSGDISDRFRRNRQDNRVRAEETIGKLGGAEKFQQRRGEQLQKNRRVVDPDGRTETGRAVVAIPDRPQREVPASLPVEQMDLRKDSVRADAGVARGETRRPAVVEDRRNPVRNENPRIATPAEVKPRPENRPQRQVESPPAPQQNDRAREENDRRQRQQQEQQQQENQRQQQQARQQEKNQRQQQQAQQQQQQEQENQRQQQQQENQRQQQQARQQEQENQRQQQKARQQGENQQREEQGRQRQQDENRSQKHQEESRQQQKDPEESRKRSR